MSTNEAAKVYGAIHDKVRDEVAKGDLKELAREALAAEHSAGAAPLDVETLAEAVVEAEPMIHDWIDGVGPNAFDIARAIRLYYARLSERTDR